MYHYVRRTDLNLPYFRHLELDDFLAQLDYFGREFGFVDRDEFLNAFEADGPFPQGVILTFDDAFSDHYRYVFPILKSRGLWGIFYVATGIFESKELLDVHRIHVLLGKCGGASVLGQLSAVVSDEMMSEKDRATFCQVTYESLQQDDCTLQVKRALNYYIREEYRKTVLDSLVTELLDDEQYYRNAFYLTPFQLREMQADGMIIGSHTVSHRVMSKLSHAEQDVELTRSFEMLERATGGLTCKTFCYPYGGFHTFTRETEQLLIRKKCMFSFNVEARDISPHDMQRRPQALPRYDCNAFPHGACRNDVEKPMDTKA